LTRAAAIYANVKNLNNGFQKVTIFCRKLVTIAEIRDHNINPRFTYKTFQEIIVCEKIVKIAVNNATNIDPPPRPRGPPPNMNRDPSGSPPVTVFVGNISERAQDAMVRALLACCGPLINWKRVQVRAARFFLLQHTKTGKIYQITIKFTIAWARRCRSSQLTRWWTQKNNWKNGGLIRSHKGLLTPKRKKTMKITKWE
jgi:hypothetical protein